MLKSKALLFSFAKSKVAYKPVAQVFIEIMRDIQKTSNDPITEANRGGTVTK